VSWDGRRNLSRSFVLPAARLSAPSSQLLALALGAAALGAVAIGALAIGRITVKKARFGTLEVDELTVRRLRIVEYEGSNPR